MSDILDEAKRQMLDVMKENETKFAEIEDPEATADLIGLSAVVVQDLSAKRIKDYTFQWERVCNFEVTSISHYYLIAWFIFIRMVANNRETLAHIFNTSILACAAWNERAECKLHLT